MMHRHLLSTLFQQKSSLRPRVGQNQRWIPTPKDYDPQFGDYPKLPWTPWSSRDPYAHWDDPDHRRNFGEPIHEEFDLQDGWFQGDQDPAKGWLLALKGQLAIAAIFTGFLGLTYVSFNPSWKPPKRTLPPEVQNYLDTAGWEKVVRRPYQPIVADEKFIWTELPKTSPKPHHH